MTQESKDHIVKVLEKLKRDKTRILLSLMPGIGEPTIRPQGNRLQIQHHGEFENVDESFYDSLVIKYDSRCRKK